jgi:hypothetical protein
MSLRPVERWSVVLLVGFGLCGCSTDSNDGGKATAATGGNAAAGQTSTTSGSSAGGGDSQGGNPGSAGNTSGGKTSGGETNGGNSSTGGSSSGGDTSAGCDTPDLTWKTANKTWYTSYPDPGSEECIKYNGCMWAGQFSACEGKKSEAWVSSHNIVAAFPDFDALQLHDLCLKSGDKKIVVTVYDTCGDDDCDGCCTENKGDADELIDLESYTNDRYGIDDGQIQWADLGPTKTSGCD